VLVQGKREGTRVFVDTKMVARKTTSSDGFCNGFCLPVPRASVLKVNQSSLWTANPQRVSPQYQGYTHSLSKWENLVFLSVVRPGIILGIWCCDELSQYWTLWKWYCNHYLVPHTQQTKSIDHHRIQQWKIHPKLSWFANTVSLLNLQSPAVQT
jgi:hypothetical protein